MAGLDVVLADGRSLEAVSHGSGGPVVVFEAGMGAGQDCWGLVTPTVAERARVVTYNRAGIGRSGADTAPRTLARAADDLLQLVGHLDAGPAVLVGHSYGGPIVRQALATAPERVAGLVLVDQTDEGCDLLFARAGSRAERVFAGALPVVARLGVTRLLARGLGRPLPPEARRRFVADSGSVGAARTHQAELATWGADLGHLRDHPHPPAAVPVTVISGTRPPRSRGAARQRNCLVAAHQRRAAAASRGRHVRAERSQHMVMFTEPGLVAREIIRLADAIASAQQIGTP